MKEFFQATMDLNFQQHFDSRREPDCRLRLFDLYKRTKETVTRERQISLEVVLLIGLLESQNAAVNLNLGKREHLGRSLGLTENQYWKRAQAGRVCVAYPQFIDLVKRGLTHISHIAILAPKITAANAAIFAEQICGKSERDVRELAASVNRDGSQKEIEATFSLKLQLTKTQLEQLDRAKEVLSRTGRVPSDEEVLLKSIEDLLEKRDPMRKAERAAARQKKKWTDQAEVEQMPSVPKSNVTTALRPDSPSVPKSNVTTTLRPDSPSVPKSNTTTGQRPGSPSLPKATIPKGRRGIPAAWVHFVWRRDQGKCCYVTSGEHTCGSKIGLQVDHIECVAFGGQNNHPSNLRLLCREHNMMEAERNLGGLLMRRYSWLSKQRVQGDGEASAS